MRQILLFGSATISLVWLLTDPRPFKTRLRDYTRANRLVYIFTEAYLILMIMFPGLAFQWPPAPLNRFVNIIGLILFCLGIGLAIWAKFTMQHNWGPPAQHEFDRQSRLVTTGPFMYSRNPIYLGLVLMFFGITFVLHSYLVFLGFVFAWYFNYAVDREEALLEQYFGRYFKQYRSATPKFFGPF